LAKYSLERFGYEIAIVRMQNGQPFRECRNAFRRIETENRKGFRRPIVKYSVRPERPTSHMSEPFSFSQIKFASLQFLRRIFLLGDIQCIPDQLHNFAILEHRLAGAMHRSLAIFRMANAILDIAGDTFRKHFLDQVCQHSPVVWVKNVEPLTEGRDALIGIETKINKRLGRPIVEYAVGPKGPASHMGQPFSFAQVKFAPLEMK